MGWFGKVLRSAPQHAQTPPVPAPAAVPAAEWRAKGNAALGQGDLAEAARCYEQGVLADATDATLRLNHGFVLLEQGLHQAAAERLLQALALRQPQDTFAHEAHYLLARAQAALGRASEALASCEAALALRPDFAEAVEEGLRACRQLGRHGEAGIWARRLLALQPSPLARMLLADALSQSGQQPEAAELLAQVCAEEPGNAEACALSFRVLFQLARFAEALAQAERLLVLAGPQAPVYVNLAAALGRVGRHEEALAAVEQALRLEPQRRDALVNRAALLCSVGRMREAVEGARAGLRLFPDDADLHWNLGVALLTLGEFEAGWVEHEWRPVRRPTGIPAPRWRGESLHGRAILLYGEQGFGDSIQFLRYLPVVARAADAVYLQVPGPLEPLVTQLPANCRMLPPGSAMPRIDCHSPLMSLPALLGTTEASIPAEVPYLRAQPQRVSAWRERLGKQRLNVGIAWSGKPTHFNDHARSMSLAQFRAAEADGCQFVTVQPQLRPEDQEALARWPGVLDAGRELRDFADTAALLAALDLVVSVDTSVAHLAGALGVPVWILLPQVPDWRWMLERDDSPWYPTARLYRQGPQRAWPEVLARVRADLSALAARG